MAKNSKTAAETTVSVRFPVEMVEAARALSEDTESHPLGKRSYTELLVAAARAGWPTIEVAAKPKGKR